MITPFPISIWKRERGCAARGDFGGKGKSVFLRLPGHPLLLLSSLVYSTEKIPFEYAKVVYRGDLIKLSFDYE